MTQTLAELKEQAEEAARKLQEAVAEERRIQREAEEAERDAERRIKRDEKRLVWLGHAEKVVAELRNIGYEDAACGFRKDIAEWSEYPTIAPNGNIEGWHRNDIAFEETYSGSYHSSRTNTVIGVGGYPSTKYPMKKDGTFSYAIIAKKFKDLEDARIAKSLEMDKKEARRTKNCAIADRVKANFGIYEYSSIVKNSEHEDGKVVITLSATLTEEEANRFLKLAVESGLVNLSR